MPQEFLCQRILADTVARLGKPATSHTPSTWDLHIQRNIRKLEQ